MDHKNIKAIISYLIITSIFVTGTANAEKITIYWYYPVYFLFIIYALYAHPRLNIKVIAAFVAVVIYALITFKSGFSLVVKQIINIGLNVVVFYFFLWHENFDTQQIFRRLISFAKVVTILGFIQVFLFAINKGWIFLAVFPFLKSYDVSVRLQSITQEPSFIAFVMAPVVFVAVHNIFYRQRYFISRTWSVLFIACYILTFSSIAFISLLTILLLVYFKNMTYRKLSAALFVFFIIGVIGYGTYYFDDNVKLRVNDTLNGFGADMNKDETFATMNPSTFALLSNMYATKEGFKENPIAGNGLGTHQIVYDNNITESMKHYFVPNLNRQDANSLALRIISELGLVGICTFLYFVIHFKLRSRKYFNETQQQLWLINCGIFVLILLALFRNGNYAVHGKILFFLMYYYSYTAARFEDMPVDTDINFPNVEKQNG